MIVHNKQNHLNHSKYDRDSYSEVKKRQQIQNRNWQQRKMNDKIRDMESEYGKGIHRR